MFTSAIFSSGQRWRAISGGRQLVIIDVATDAADRIVVHYDDAKGTFVLRADELVFDYEPVFA